MAVIDTSMDIPESCYKCPKRNICSLATFNAWIIDKRDDNCPLKSTDDYILRETVFDFNVKLDKWLFHNHEDVCGQRMVDIDYLSGEIWELFTELGIVRYDEDGKEQENEN